MTNFHGKRKKTEPKEDDLTYSQSLLDNKDHSEEKCRSEPKNNED